ncbi:MAG: gliding motility-associated C-terminal domain-containing protein [Bacteroidales bacterium]|nr:gliding motility-associated C-terminal domain-containing protein [Bacteroidales bacterium]
MDTGFSTDKCAHYSTADNIRKGFDILKAKTLLLVMILAAISSWAQVRPTPMVAHGYSFITGVDSTLWSTTYLYRQYINYFPSGIFLYGAHNFFDTTLHNYIPTAEGGMRLTPNGGIWGWRDFSSEPTKLYRQYGNENRMGVWFRGSMDSTSNYSREWQIIFESRDNSFAIVYGPRNDTVDRAVPINVQGSPSQTIHIDPRNHTISDTLIEDSTGASWPGDYRYYKFMPECQLPQHFVMDSISGPNWLRHLSWDTDSGYWFGIVTSDNPNGQFDSSQIRWTTDNHMTVEPFIFCYLVSPCFYRDSSIYLLFQDCRTPDFFALDSLGLTDSLLHLSWDSDSGFWYGIVTSDNPNGQFETSQIRWTTDNHMAVESARYFYLVWPCMGQFRYIMMEYNGFCHPFESTIDYSIYSPSALCQTKQYRQPWIQQRVDWGYLSRDSRHTIHCDPEETDPRTGGQLHTVPEGYPASVRLGNWNCQAEMESITYTLHIDTNNYDLLLLRYALVEEAPGHSASMNPQFTYSICDTNDQLISNCLYGNFVSGDQSLWNHSDGNVVWKDWTAIGVDLASLHGQTIKVKLENSDCKQGGHYGYGYFVLDGGTKHLNYSSCGSSYSNTIYAPKGFAYRWYSEDDPSTTLSTVDSLVVSQEGHYCCRVRYLLSDTSCGFTLHTNVGPRYPKADFDYEHADSCASIVQFFDRSSVAHDAELTILSSEPCENCIWDFGDGLTSNLRNPSHHYSQPGLYRVTQYALLARGTCIDSAWQMVDIVFPSTDLFDTICQGQQYSFHNDTLTLTGDYPWYGTCHQEVMHLTSLTYPPHLDEPQISCPDKGFKLALCDTLYYLFDTILAQDPPMQDAISGLTQWLISPADSLRLSVAAGVEHMMRCPTFDTFNLFPISNVEIQLIVQPESIFAQQNLLTATDLGSPEWIREWYVNGLLQSETSNQLQYLVPLENDNVHLMLVAYNDFCADTEYAIIPILSDTPYFPNIFTPDEPSNNRFRGYGSNIRDYQLDIYTKWGDRFFHSHDINESWDGTLKGVKCPQSAYVYVCHYTTPQGEAKRIVGSVLLVR